VYRYNIYIRYNYNGNNKYETTTLVFGEYLKNNGNKQTKTNNNFKTKNSKFIFQTVIIIIIIKINILLYTILM
jgi:hypothetical protein